MGALGFSMSPQFVSFWFFGKIIGALGLFGKTGASNLPNGQTENSQAETRERDSELLKQTWFVASLSSLVPC